MKRKKVPKRSVDKIEDKNESTLLNVNEAEEEYEVKVLSGTGRITSSGLAIQGHYTEFMNQLEAGDAIIITHPTR